MADLGTAYVRVAPNMTGIQGKIAAGFKGAAGPATAALGDEVDSNSGPFQSALGKLGGFAKGAGVAIAGGLAAGATGLAALTTKSLMAGAQLEQNLGGAEAVFGKYADTIKQEAGDAFAFAGLSQNEFLAGANKMGSLFQGSGFSVEKSMNMTVDAMQRASDVASIMGLDTTAALEAVTGMAKGNFTMMDNLGVKMDDTTIAAYAMSKGIKGVNGALSAQEKVGVATQIFMEQTAKYAGNYHKENDTLAGSLNSTKKAFDNLLSGQGDIGGFIEMLVNTIKIAVPQIVKILPQMVDGIGAVLKAIVPALSAALPTLIPALVSAAKDLILALVKAMPSVVQALLGALPTLIDAFIQLFLAIVQALPEIVTNIANALPTIINALVTGLTNPAALQAIIMGTVQLLLALVQAIPIIIPALVDAMPIIIKNIIATLTDPKFISQMINAGVLLMKATINGIVSMGNSIGGAVGDILKIIGDTLSPSNLYKVGTDVVTGLWAGIKDMGSWLSSKITNFVMENIPGPIKSALGIHSPSRVAAELGMQIPAGLAQGINQGVGVVEKAAINMANSALTDMTASAVTPSMAGSLTAPAQYGAPAMPTAVAGAADIVQNNNIYNQVDLGSVTRELAWQIRR
jgi:phage-related protein